MKPKIFEISKFQSPIEIFSLFAKDPNSVFLDSAKYSYKFGRYSFIARDPFLIFSCKGNNITIIQNSVQKNFIGCPFNELKKLMKIYKTKKIKNMPPFLGGAIGYFGYDLAYLLEDLPKKSLDIINTKDCWFGFYDCILSFDNYKQKCYIIATGFPEQSVEKQQKRSEIRIKEMQKLISKDVKFNIPVKLNKKNNFFVNFSSNSYCDILSKIIKYIYDGDIFQVNMTQCFSTPFDSDPFEMYRYLRHINPAPFSAYLNCSDVIIACTSPERYLSLNDGIVETRPIKGTRPRGNDVESDLKLRNELEKSVKDKAELIMIIDLLRNDLGRVCDYGTVNVSELICLEEYATVFHLVSTIIGKLMKGKDIIDLIKASFPGGSITGAPKVRAMEIIDEFEPQRRGIYTGAIGYLDFNGDADLNIVIRTIIIKDKKAYFQVGGGIVADSEPEFEYKETLYKAKAMFEALGQKGNK